MKQKIVAPQLSLEKPNLKIIYRVMPSTRWMVRRVLVLIVSMFLMGSSAIPSDLARFDYFGLAVGRYSWDLLGWEAQALFDKAVAAISKPANKATNVQI